MYTVHTHTLINATHLRRSQALQLESNLVADEVQYDDLDFNNYNENDPFAAFCRNSVFTPIDAGEVCSVRTAHF